MADDTDGREILLKQDHAIRDRAKSGLHRNARGAKAVVNRISLEHDNEICNRALSPGCTRSRVARGGEGCWQWVGQGPAADSS
jgi:hypothetical protein